MKKALIELFKTKAEFSVDEIISTIENYNIKAVIEKQLDTVSKMEGVSEVVLKPDYYDYGFETLILKPSDFDICFKYRDKPYIFSNFLQILDSSGDFLEEEDAIFKAVEITDELRNIVIFINQCIRDNMF